MEMWLKQLTLVMFAVAVAGMVILPRKPVILDKTQKKVDVPYGSSLVLFCNLKIQESERARVSWYFNPSGPSYSNSKNLSGKIITQTVTNTSKKTNQDSGGEGQETVANKLFTLSLFHVTHNDSGWYFCEVTVEIPVYNSFFSSGTQVNVTSENIMENTTHPSLVTSKEAVWPPSGSVIEWWMWIIVGGSAFILIILLVICILLRRRCLKSREPDPIYINTRPMVNKQPSPRLSGSVDNLKTASASQNLRTPSPARRYEEGKRRPRH